MTQDGAPPPTKTRTRDDAESNDDVAKSNEDVANGGLAANCASEEPDPHGDTLLAAGATSRGAAMSRGAATSRGAASSPSGDEDRSGETLGRFKLLSRLGEGGMGVVYSAEDLRLGRTVALKILSPEAVLREDRRRRFLREARAASAVMHPNIAAIFEVGEEAGEVFLAMERVAGQTLRAALRERATPFDVERALAIARDVATGLREAHAAGIVHRDLKPENVMITPDGQVKILDFGLAKRLAPADSAPPPSREQGTGDLATTEGQIMGTAGYMSPEQALGEPVDTRTDLFSLGVLLYELLTQTRPFQGESRMAVLVATHRDSPAPPSARNPAVPPGADAVVLRCLAKSREDRFQTAAEVIEAIDEVLRAAREASSGARSSPPKKRALGLGTPALVVAVLAVGAAVAAAMGLRGSPEIPGSAASGLPGSGAPPGSLSAANGTGLSVNGTGSAANGTGRHRPARGARAAPRRQPRSRLRSRRQGQSLETPLLRRRCRGGLASRRSRAPPCVAVTGPSRGAIPRAARWGVVEKASSQRAPTGSAFVRPAGRPSPRHGSVAVTPCPPTGRPRTAR